MAKDNTPDSPDGAGASRENIRSACRASHDFPAGGGNDVNESQFAAAILFDSTWVFGLCLINICLKIGYLV